MTMKDNGGSPPRRRLPLRLLLIGLILLAGMLGAYVLKKTAPRAQRVAPQPQARWVAVRPVTLQDAQVRVRGFGQVVAARQIELKAQVAGEVVALHPQFREGACLPAGTLLVQLDARDYQLALAQREAAVRQAEARLALEEGQQQVARQEWQRYQSSGQPLPESAHLVLRQPQLEQARADLASARAALGQARLELERTAIRLPFDALILRQQVEQGAQLAAQGTVATLVDSGTFEVEVTVPLDALALLDLPRPGHLTGGAGARIERTDRPGGGSARQGQVIALLGELADGRMARLRVAVADPLALRAATPPDWPLLLGDYVAVSLLGRLLPQVAVVPRALLRDGDQLWLLTPQQTLEIRPVEVLWRDQHQVYLRGVVAGEQLVETDLAAPVAGMALRPLVPEDDA